MKDNVKTVQELKDAMAQFVKERDWNQFHVPKSLSMALSIEAAELMEKFLWVDNDASWQRMEVDRDAIEQEMADVLSYLLALANACNVDLSKAFEKKMVLNEKKYPIAKSKGRSDKYTTYI